MERTENNMILALCTRGSSCDIMATARANGARGGTVIKGHLSGLEDLEQAYNMELQEDREIVTIIVPTSLRAGIIESINREHGLRSKAQAIIYSLPIDTMMRL